MNASVNDIAIANYYIVAKHAFLSSGILIWDRPFLARLNGPSNRFLYGHK